MLILSARRSVDDRVRGLQAGGDDYLTKPFAFAELLARVQALVRRALAHAGADDADRRRSDARSADAQGRPADGIVDRAAAARVRAARIPDAQRRQGRLEDDDPVARLGVQLRSADQHRRRAGQPPARQDRQAVRDASCCTRCGASAMSSARARAAGVRPAARPVVRDALRHRRDRDRLAHLLPDGGVARAARSADHRAEARRVRRRSTRAAASGRSPTRCSAEQRTAPERLFVRVVDRGRETIVLSAAAGVGLGDARDASRGRCRTARSCRSARAPSSRQDLLARFRATLGLVTLSIVDRRAHRRVARHAVGAPADPAADRRRSARIIRTGRTDERVPVGAARRCDRRADGAVQRHARQDRRPGHRHARRARQRLARSAHAADAAARHRGDGARRPARYRSLSRGARRLRRGDRSRARRCSTR